MQRSESLVQQQACHLPILTVKSATAAAVDGLLSSAFTFRAMLATSSAVSGVGPAIGCEMALFKVTV